MLELYHNDMSTCAKKVRLVLVEKALQWTSHHMNLRAGETRTKEYIEKLNPLGVVPTLVNDGEVICESTVIMEYLDDAYPETPLRPEDPVARARMRLWTRKLDEGLHADTAIISSCIAFRYQIMDGRNEQEVRDFINLSPNIAVRERSHDIIFTGMKSKLFPPAILRFKKLFGDMEKVLSNSDWLAGENFSLADIAYIPYLTRFEHLQLLGMLDNHPGLTGWYHRVKARPSYEEALRKWFNEKYLVLMEEKGKESWPTVKNILELK